MTVKYYIFLLNKYVTTKKVRGEGDSNRRLKVHNLHIAVVV